MNYRVHKNSGNPHAQMWREKASWKGCGESVQVEWNIRVLLAVIYKF